jgi:hypothetical protein
MEIRLYRLATSRQRKELLPQRDQQQAQQQRGSTPRTARLALSKHPAVTCTQREMEMSTRTRAAGGRATTTEVGILQMPRRNKRGVPRMRKEINSEIRQLNERRLKK